MEKKKVKKKKRSKAGFVQSTTHSDKISDYKYDSKPGVLMKDKVSGAKENPADVTLKRMMQGDVFRSAETTVKGSNSNKRRYK
jgi:hypothetical protein